MYECGCQGAALRRNSPTNYVPTLNTLNGSREPSDPSEVQSPGLAHPQQAHIGGPNTHAVQRPMHLLRAPSFNPPPFEEEEPPPPLVTPPPQYDTIASPTSGLADYFSRLSDAYDDDDDGDTRSTRSRVEVPLTPGTRAARSMDVPRTWTTVGQTTQ
jgi:arrestin-related trafficking adapter 3/6